MSNSSSGGSGTPHSASASGSAAGGSASSWETDAESLAQQLAQAGNDPTAKEVADNLAAVGITAAQNGASVFRGDTSGASTTSPPQTSAPESGGSNRSRDHTGNGGNSPDSGTGSGTVDGASRGTGSHNGNDGTGQGSSFQSGGQSGNRPTGDPGSGTAPGQLGGVPSDDNGGQPAPSPEPAPSPNTAPPRPAATPASDTATWDQLAGCESAGNWSINTGNGYSGGLQLDTSTWAAYGGTAYASTAAQASKDQQITVATKVLDDRGGYSAWPACSARLGLK